MDTKEAIKERHSVRQFKDLPVKSEDREKFDEKCGYYGQKIVLEAQALGLNTCWVAGTYGKGKCKAGKNADEKIVCVIALGYGESQGVAHKSKPLSKLCTVPETDLPGAPSWFRDGLEAAILAPTALNQQKFLVSLEGDEAASGHKVR